MTTYAVSILLLVFALNAHGHLFTFKAGGKLEADFLEFKDANTVVVKGAKDGKSYALPIAQLIEADQKFLADLRSKSDLKADLKRTKGFETTVKEIQNFPERTMNRDVWMDVTFGSLYESHIKIWLGEEYLRTHLGFAVTDKNGDYFTYCIIEKGPNATALEKIKKGQKLRLIGHVTKFDRDPWLFATDFILLPSEKKEAE
jgi:hypothetical protein